MMIIDKYSRNAIAVLLIFCSIVIAFGGCKEDGSEQQTPGNNFTASSVDTSAAETTHSYVSVIEGDPYKNGGPLESSSLSRDYSSLTISIYEAGELLIIDPDGLRTGFAQSLSRALNEIPRSAYGIEVLPDIEERSHYTQWKVLEIMKLKGGDYTLQVSREEEGIYSLEFLIYNAAGDSKSLLTREAEIAESAIHTYILQYDKYTNSIEHIMHFRGGYDGMGDEKGDENLLLSYFTCSSSEIELPTQTKQYSIGVWYYEGVDPETFSATLSGEDITALFKPKANSNEVVTLDLSKGSNSLVLKIEGDVQSRRLIDTDTFEITVSP